MTYHIYIAYLRTSRALGIAWDFLVAVILEPRAALRSPSDTLLAVKIARLMNDDEHGYDHFAAHMRFHAARAEDERGRRGAEFIADLAEEADRRMKAEDAKS